MRTMRYNIFRFHGLDDCERSRRNNRRPTKRGGMCPGGKCRCNLFRSKYRADRQAVSQRFCQRHDIRHNAKMLICKQLSGPPHTCLDFIEHQQCSGIITKFSNSLQVGRRWAPNATLSLDRLQHDCRRR